MMSTNINHKSSVFCLLFFVFCLPMAKVSFAAVEFSDNFEDWALPAGQWTGAVNSAGSVSTATVFGNCALKCADSSISQNAVYLRKSLTPASQYYVRVYFYLPDGFWDGISTTQYQEVYFLGIYNAPGGYIYCTLSNQSFRKMLRLNASTTFFENISEEKWHCIEILASASAATTATIRCWLNGVEQSPFDISLTPPTSWNELRTGIIYSNTNTITPTMYFDEVKVATLYIGTTTITKNIPPPAPVAYYVDGTSGDDSRDGRTLSTAWKTIFKANQQARPGDTVYIRGGSYYATSRLEYGGQAEKQGIRPERSGIQGYPITYCAYNGESVTITGNSDAMNRPYGVDLDGRSYIIVRGIKFYSLTYHLLIRNGHHNEIAYCSFDKNYSFMDWCGSKIKDNSTYNYIHHSTFSNYGDALGGSDNSVVLEIGNENVSDDFTSYNLIEACHLYHGGHHVLGLNGCYNVARNNYMHNEPWAADEYGKLWGNRVLNLCTVYPDCNKRNLIENNRIAYSTVSVDAPALFVEGSKIAHSYNIIRRNLFYQHPSSALSHQYYPPAGESKYNHDYHNTIYRTGLDFRTAIFFNSYGATPTFLPIYGNVIKNNIIIDEGSITLVTILNTVAENNFTAGDPLWVSSGIPASPFDANQPDFYLKEGSPCKNTGGFLTKIASADSSGIQFQVQDAGYFMDGWGIIQGDLIQLEGNTQKARITNVDYNSNTITVDRNLTWTQNIGVSLAYEGSAPDIGAHEYYPSGFDTTPPGAPGTVRDGATAGTDAGFTYSMASLSANWTASTDAESGIFGYQYAIGTSPAGTDVANWTTLGNVLTVTKTGLELTLGTAYYFSVKAENGAGLTGNPANSNGQLVVADTTPPGAPGTVRDGATAGTDAGFTYSTTTLSANWTAATDAETGISGYQYAIGARPAGTDVASWTVLGNVLTVTKTGLNLAMGTTYYFSVKAVNTKGLTGSAGNSDGQFVREINTGDTTPPGPPSQVSDGTSATADFGYTASATELSASWSDSADAESGISRYLYAIGSSPGATDITGWTDNGQLTDVTKTGVALTIGTTYYFSVKAENGVGLQSSATNSNGQCVVSSQAEVPPVISNVQAANITANSAAITWTTDKQATSQAEYGITAVYGSQTTEDSSLVTVHNVVMASLSAGRTYHYRVISKDSNGRIGMSVDCTFATLSSPTEATDIKAYPNPHDFKNGVPVKFTVGGAKGGEVKIYTIRGKLVRKLRGESGTGEIQWDGTNEGGEKVARGVYIYIIIQTNGDKTTGKIGITR